MWVTPVHEVLREAGSTGAAVVVVADGAGAADVVAVLDGVSGAGSGGV